MQKKRWPLLLLLLFSLSTAFVFLLRSAFDSCSTGAVSGSRNFVGEETYQSNGVLYTPSLKPNPLEFMRSKLVLLVSHELSLS
ncbi:hypothetical protein CRG98_029979, partial [Punica granatum]